MNIVTKRLGAYSRKELMALPRRNWDEKSIYDSVLVIPSHMKHDSGWAMMIIIGVREGKPIEVISTSSDDIEWVAPAPRAYSGNFAVGQMRTDCVFKSKAMHYWSHGHSFKVGHALSSITITLVKKEK